MRRTRRKRRRKRKRKRKGGRTEKKKVEDEKGGGEERKWCPGGHSLLPAGAGLQETLAAVEGTQDLPSPHIHSAERTADRPVFETQ